MKKVAVLMLLAALVIGGSAAAELVHQAGGSVSRSRLNVYSQDGKYLGCASCLMEDPESIGNDSGKYGSRFQANSMRNEVGKYGSEVSNYSWRNPVATKPPLVKTSDGQVLGTITLNEVDRRSLKWKYPQLDRQIKLLLLRR